MTQATHDRIVQNPAFRQILAVALELARAQSNVVKEMSTADRRAYVDKANALAAEVRSGAASKRSGAAADLGGLYGLTEAQVTATVGRARTAAQEFNAGVPEFAELPAQVRVDMLVEVIRADPAVARFAAELAAAAGPESTQTCLAICVALLLVFLAAGMTMMALGLVACGGLILIPPLMVLCIIGVLAAFAAYLAILFEIYQNCVANCKEAGPEGKY